MPNASLLPPTHHLACPPGSRRARSQASDAPDRMVSLLNSFGAVAGLARARARAGNWADTFLLLCGLSQMAEDYLERDLAQMARLGAMLGRRSPALGSAVAHLSGFVATIRGHCLQEVRVASWQVHLERAIEAAAERVISPTAAPRRDALQMRCRRVLEESTTLPRDLTDQVLKLPACFRAADQRPEDCMAIAQAFAHRWGEPRRPLVVVGIRTSGSYLAPLVAAALRSLGFADVSTISCRPAHGLRRRRAQLISAASAQGGLFLVVDDSPVGGRTYHAAAQQLIALGVRRTSIVLLVAPLHRPLPRALAGYQTVTLPWSEWCIHRSLEPEAVRDSLGRLLLGRRAEIVRPDGSRTWVTVGSIGDVRRIALAPVRDLKAGRSHVRARYRASVIDRDSGERWEAGIYVKGTGYGYFGAHSVEVSGRLTAFLPPVYGIDGSLLFRAWIPDENRFDPRTGSATQLATRVATYAAARRERLSLAFDPTEGMDVPSAAWRSAADWLQLPFGGARLLARSAAHRASRRLLRPPSPAVVDGSMALARWYGPEATALKVDYDERGLELLSCDPVADVAWAAADACLVLDQHQTFSLRARQHFQELTGEVVDDERWLLLRTVHLLAYLNRLRWAWSGETPVRWDRSELAGAIDAARRALSQTHREYVSAVYFADVVRRERGPVCAVDLDAGLVTETLGYPALTPLAALSLRTMARHGYRTILVTRRPISEVREICTAFRLAGAVAEGGSVLHDPNRGRHQVLVDRESRRALRVVRQWLRSQGALVDSTYAGTVAAYVMSDDAVRRPVGSEVVRGALERGAGLVEAAVGTSQVDFRPRQTDSGSGLRYLLGELGTAGRLEAAIGDAKASQAVFGLAARAGPVADATKVPGSRAVNRAARPAASSVAQAVGDLLGHRVGGCAVCRMPPLPSRTRLMVGMLEATDLTAVGKVGHALKLSVQLGLAEIRAQVGDGWW